jgi:hypothetical protein
MIGGRVDDFPAAAWCTRVSSEDGRCAPIPLVKATSWNTNTAPNAASVSFISSSSTNQATHARAAQNMKNSSS